MIAEGDAEGDVLDTEQAGPAAVRGGILRAGGYVFGALLSLASAALLFRHLGVDDTGRWVTIQSIVLIVAGITDAGLTAIGTREYAVLDGAARTAALRSLFGLRLLLTLVGTLVAIGFTAIAGYGATLVLGTAITCLGLLLTMVQHQYGIGLTARLRLGWVSAADVVRQAVQALAIVLLVVAGAELLDFFWAVTIGCAAGALTILVAARGTIPMQPALALRRLAHAARRHAGLLDRDRGRGAVLPAGDGARVVDRLAGGDGLLLGRVPRCRGAVRDPRAGRRRRLPDPGARRPRRPRAVGVRRRQGHRRPGPGRRRARADARASAPRS